MQINDLKGLYIAHRGVHNSEIIENTIPAFSLAISKNTPIELDVNILKDGNIVVYHDSNLNRLMNIDQDISEYNYSDLKKLVFPNTDIHIPLFSEVLELVNGKVLVVVEIKKSKTFSCSDYCKRIVSILEKYSGNFIIKSFDIKIVKWFLKNTNYITGLLITKRKNNYNDMFVNSNFGISLINPDFISVSTKIMNSRVIQNFRKKHPVLIWTIKNKETLNSSLEYGDSFIVDDYFF